MQSLNKQYNQRKHPILEPNELDEELAQLPSPPSDLPRVWNYTLWQRILSVGFFLLLFITWFIGKALNIAFMEIRTFGGSLIFSFGVLLFLGLYLLIRFQMRGYQENYSRRANKPLHQAIKKYRRPRHTENILAIFPRYKIDDEDYYLVWYVPGSGTVFPASLEPGSEPLIFDKDGKWLDDKELFYKLALMWMHALDMAPRSLQYTKIRNAKKYCKLIQEYLDPLPEILHLNKKAFVDQGLKDDIDLILQKCPAMFALYRNSLDTNYKLIQWAEAFGWDSMTLLFYDVILDFHNQNDIKQKAKEDFIKRHNTEAVNEAATKLVLHINDKKSSSYMYYQKSKLLLGLLALTERFLRPEDQFQCINGQWVCPDKMLKSYRSRVTFARQVDEKDNN